MKAMPPWIDINATAVPFAGLLEQQRLLVFPLLVGFDKLSDFRSRAHGLNQHNMMLVQEHAIRTVPLIAPAH
jgi:hypothetical protein